MGGKSRLVQHILALFPKHHTYCEPFGGGASLLLAKRRTPVEVYADADKRLVNFFRVLQKPELFRDFHRQAMLTPYSRYERDRARTDEPYDDPVAEARRLFILSQQSFGGLVNKTAWGFVTSPSGSGDSAQTTKHWISAVKRLPSVHARLRKVRIEHKLWQESLKAYDAKDTLFYLDPPYVPDTRRDGHYVHEMTVEDHADMVEKLLKVKGRMILSGYPHEVYRPLVEAGWRTQTLEVACMVVARTKQTGLLGRGALDTQKRTERCWISP